MNPLHGIAAAALFVSACGNGVVTLAGTGTGGAAPTGLVSFGAGGDGSGGPSPATPAVGSLSGSVGYGLAVAPLGGATVSLAPPAAPPATTDGSGGFTFSALPPGSYLLTATYPGLAPASQPVTVGGDPAFASLSLEVSVPLLVPDGGNDVPWLAFAPDDSLYVSTGEALFRVGDGGVATLWNDGSAVEPLGFGASGELVYLSDCDGGAPRSCRLAFGDAPAADGGRIDLYPDAGPFLVGDQVIYAADATSSAGTNHWEAISPEAIAPIGEFYADPAPGPAPNGSAVAFLRLHDGKVVTYSDAGVTPIASILENMECGLSGSAFVPLAPNLVVCFSPLDARGAVLEASAGTPQVTFAPGTRVAPGAPGSALVAFVSDGQEWLYRVTATGTTAADWVVLPATAWPPVPSPNGRFAAFTGTPIVADLDGATAIALPETPAQLVFSGDGSSLLLVDGQGSLHLLELAAGGVKDELLEGKDVTAAAFTPDGRSVVYAGGDALANAGVFIQPTRLPPGIGGAAGP